MFRLLSWKIIKSVFIAIFSGLGMIALLWIFPTKTEQKKFFTSSFPRQNSSQTKENFHLMKKTNPSFETTQQSQEDKNFHLYFYQKEFALRNDQFSFQRLDIENQNLYGYSFSNNNLHLNISSNFTSRNFQEKTLFSEFQSNQRLGNYYTHVNYKIYPYLSTEINLQHNTYTFHLNGDYSSLITGIQLKPNRYFSTSFFTGETFLYWNLNRNQNFVLNYLDNPYVEASERRNRFELKTEFRPIKNLFFQTSVYNTEQFYDEINSTRGTKFVFGYGLDFLQLSLKYNYLGNHNFRSGRIFENNPQSRDAGGVGITIFLDKRKDLSLYLGNNYFNLFNSPRYEDKNNPLPYMTSFTASLRGRTLQRGFLFFNLRNQVSRDLQYINFGNLRLPTQSTYQDTATSLGLEIWF